MTRSALSMVQTDFYMILALIFIMLVSVENIEKKAEATPPEIEQETQAVASIQGDQEATQEPGTSAEYLDGLRRQVLGISPDGLTLDGRPVSVDELDQLIHKETNTVLVKFLSEEQREVIEAVGRLAPSIEIQ